MKMRKYYIGLAIIVLLSAGLAVYIVSLGVISRQDNITQKRATEIAQQLNNYVTDNQRVPESLEEAGAKDVPSTITYTGQGDSYEFCVNYKTDSDSSYYGASNAATSLIFGDFGMQPYFDDYPAETEQSYLYLSPQRKKGETCYKVRPYTLPYFNNSQDLFQGSGTGGGASGSSISNDYYEELCKQNPDSELCSTPGAGSSGVQLQQRTVY
jgi:type II secretory pathway pseudopilin PulG